MIQEFEDDGLRFRYPENWRLERQENESGWSVSVQSPDTAFFMMSFDRGTPTVEDVAETALAALREEYSELEAEDRVDSVAGLPAVGHDIRFFSLDLTNTCWTRSFYAPGGTVLILCEINDLELETNEPVLRAICASLEVDDE